MDDAILVVSGRRVWGAMRGSGRDEAGNGWKAEGETDERENGMEYGVSMRQDGIDRVEGISCVGVERTTNDRAHENQALCIQKRKTGGQRGRALKR